MHSNRQTCVAHEVAITRAQQWFEAHPDAVAPIPGMIEAAAYSRFHFHRVFRQLRGETPSAWIRRRRLERAAFQLTHTRATASEAALDNGYSDFSAFTRAFGKHHGAPPSGLRTRPTPQTDLSSEERRWLENISPRRQREPRKRLRVLCQEGDLVQATREARARMSKLVETLSPKLDAIYGLTPDFPRFTAASRWRYHAAILEPENAPPASTEFYRMSVPPGDYVHFVLPPDTRCIQQTNRYWTLLYEQWLPASRLRIALDGAYERLTPRDGEWHTCEIAVRLESPPNASVSR